MVGVTAMFVYLHFPLPVARGQPNGQRTWLNPRGPGKTQDRSWATDRRNRIPSVSTEGLVSVLILRCRPAVRAPQHVPTQPGPSVSLALWRNVVKQEGTFVTNASRTCSRSAQLLWACTRLFPKLLNLLVQALPAQFHSG